MTARRMDQPIRRTIVIVASFQAKTKKHRISWRLRKPTHMVLRIRELHLQLMLILSFSHLNQNSLTRRVQGRQWARHHRLGSWYRIKGRRHNRTHWSLLRHSPFKSSRWARPSWFLAWRTWVMPMLCWNIETGAWQWEMPNGLWTCYFRNAKPSQLRIPFSKGIN